MWGRNSPADGARSHPRSHQAIGGPPGAGPRALSGQVTLHESNGARYGFTVGANGRFSVPAPVGKYTVSGQSPQLKIGSVHHAFPKTGPGREGIGHVGSGKGAAEAVGRYDDGGIHGTSGETHRIQVRNSTVTWALIRRRCVQRRPLRQRDRRHLHREAKRVTKPVCDLGLRAEPLPARRRPVGSCPRELIFRMVGATSPAAMRPASSRMTTWRWTPRVGSVRLDRGAAVPQRDKPFFLPIRSTTTVRYGAASRVRSSGSAV